MSYGVTGDRELVQMPPNRGGSVLILWGKAPKACPSRSLIVWMNAPRPGPHHDAQIYSATVTSWLDFLAERLAAEFVHELREDAAP